MSNTSDVTAADVTSATFRTRFRGVDPDEVDVHLAKVERTMRLLESRISEQQSVIDEKQAELDELASSPQDTPSMIEAALADPDLAARLDADTLEMVEAAKVEAEVIRQRADEDAADIVAQAEQLYAERSKIADEEAARIRSEMGVLREQRLSEIDSEVATARQAAEREIASLGERAQSERTEATDEAARLVHEAQVVRRQILEDLARRRSSARRQIEQLRAGRDRLLASHEVVRRSLEEVTDELNKSMTEARAAAETAGRRVSDSTVEELEAEIETARLSGLLDTGPVPVVQTTKPAEQPNESPNTPAETDVDGSSESTEPSDSESAAETAASESAPEATSDPESADETTAAGEADSTDGPESADDSESASEPESATESATQIRGESPLAAVVDLDSARHDVDTATHPSTGRKAVADGPASPLKSVPDAADGDVVFEDEDLDVDALFARMRSVQTPDSDIPAAPSEKDSASTTSADETSSKKSQSKKSPAKKSQSKKSPAKKTPAKKTRSKKTTAKKSTADKTPEESAATPESTDLTEVGKELSRQLKRVLADEQSAMLSTLRGEKALPNTDDVLADETQHQNAYWTAVRSVVTDAVTEDGDAGIDVDSLRNEVDQMVRSLRGQVVKSIDAADDPDAAIDDLRKIYRDVKTRRIAEHVEALCDGLRDLRARGNATVD